MRNIWFLIAFLFLFPQTVSAHSEGLVPFFKMNDELPKEYPLMVENISPQTIDIPQDIAPQTYLANEPIDFLIDTQLLKQVYPEETLQKLTYQWEFGDGAKAEGVVNTHEYKSIGTYTLRIYAAFSETGVAPQLIQSTQVHIVPTKDYKLPNPQIRIKRVPITDGAASLNMQRPVNFEASFAEKPQAEIVSYQWDFGDGQKATGESVVYEYGETVIAATPVLRVTDKNGFVADTFVLLTNDANAAGINLDTNLTGSIILGVQLLVISVGGLWFARVILKKKQKKHKR